MGRLHGSIFSVLLVLLVFAPAVPAGGALAHAGVAAAPSVAAAAMPRLSLEPPSQSLTPAAPVAPALGAAYVAPAVASPSLGVSFDALTMTNNSFTITPPDVIVAAGPNHVVEMVNLVMGIYSKAGVPLATRSLGTFFGTGTDYISDPKVQYDAASGRWFATILDFASSSKVTTGQVYLAVSGSPDPTGIWKVYKVPSSVTGECLDQPILGVAGDKVVISVNAFSSCTVNLPAYLGAEWWVISKADLVASAATPATQSFGPDPLLISVHPAEGGTTTLHMVATNWTGTTNSASKLILFTLTGLPPSAKLARQDVSIRTVSIAPGAPQQGSSGSLDTGDIRVLDAAEAGSTLWLSLESGCIPAGDTTTRACGRVIELNLSPPSVLEDFDVSAAGKYYLYPAVRADASGNALVVIGESSSAEYPSLVAAGRVFGDAANVYQTPVTVQAGSSPVTVLCSGGSCRYGDYFGASLDPSDPHVLWGAGEYGSGNIWATRVFAAEIKAMLRFNYSVVGGSSGSSAPTLSYVLGGVAASTALSAAPTTVLADPGTSWSVSPQLPGSSPSTGNVWAVDEGAGAPPVSGFANASLTQTFRYFHQYSVAFGFHVVGGGGYGSAARFNGTAFGRPVAITAPDTLYLDAGSAYAYPSDLSGSGNSERWHALSPPSGTVSAALNVSATYYHQAVVTFLYTVQGASYGTPPQVHYSFLGSAVSTRLNTTAWADVQASYSYDSALSGGSASVRWGTGSNGNGTITAPGTITVAYREQFRVNVVSDPASLSSSLTGSGWYDPGAALTLTASAPTGWRFDHWAGDASGNLPSFSGTVQGPMNITAVYDAGLTITAGEGGSITYSYGSTSGTVSAGSAATIYVPVGTAVTLTGVPGSWDQTFTGWTGAASGAAASTTVQVSAPGTVVGSFGFNLVVVGGISLLVVFVIVALVILAVVRRRRRRPPN